MDVEGRRRKGIQKDLDGRGRGRGRGREGEGNVGRGDAKPWCAVRNIDLTWKWKRCDGR